MPSLDLTEKKGTGVMQKLVGIKACVFDAYGTLFDINSAAHNARDSLAGKWQPLAELWRIKQLQYTWLLGLAGRHADFWQVTGDALDFALSTIKLIPRQAPSFALSSPIVLSPESLGSRENCGTQPGKLKRAT